jgi:hypothetical protein
LLLLETKDRNTLTHFEEKGWEEERGIVAFTPLPSKSNKQKT